MNIRHHHFFFVLIVISSLWTGTLAQSSGFDTGRMDGLRENLPDLVSRSTLHKLTADNADDADKKQIIVFFDLRYPRHLRSKYSKTIRRD